MVENRPTYHNSELKAEGEISKGFNGQPGIRNIAGEGKASCVVFNIGSKWQSKQDGGYHNWDCKILGSAADEFLEEYQEGDRIVVWGELEKDEPYPRKVTLEDGSEGKAMLQRDILMVRNFDRSRRFENSNRDFGGNNNSAVTSSNESSSKPAAKKSSSKRSLL